MQAIFDPVVASLLCKRKIGLVINVQQDEKAEILRRQKDITDSQ